MIPILFLHRGYSLYMDYTLQQCRYANPDADIFLLGDEQNNRFSFLHHCPLSALPVSYQAFDGAYKHLSTNDEDYELFCFHRWFILKEFMIQRGLSTIFVCDTDLMVYKNIAGYTAWNNRDNAYAAFCISSQSMSAMHWCASAHSSYWTLEGLTAFCLFLEQTYQTNLNSLAPKWQHHTDNELPGGICDMTLLYLFYMGHKSRILNLLDVRNGEVFDNNINEGHNLLRDEYETNEKGWKDIKFVNDRATAFNRPLGKPVQLNTLHFQGPGKQYVHDYYRGPAATQLFIKRMNDKTARRYNHYKGQLMHLLMTR